MATKHRRGRGADAKGRSKGGEQFVPIPYNMARSANWRTLSGPAVKVYIELRSRYNGFNNGELSLSLDEAARLLGLGKATVVRALAQLEERGFITVARRGRWRGRLATTYEVTDRRANGELATQKWRDWKPEKTVSRSPGGPVKVTNGSATEPKNTSMGPLQNRSGQNGKSDGSATEPPISTRGGL